MRSEVSDTVGFQPQNSIVLDLTEQPGFEFQPQELEKHIGHTCMYAQDPDGMEKQRRKE